MSGEWNEAKVEAFKAAFFEFLNHVRVNSKELGNIILGEHLYRAQHRFLDAVFDGLSKDKHDIKHLKSRQLGVSTISRALTLFWIGVNDGLKGYMVFDTDGHKEEARLELIGMINSLPDFIKFPRVKRQNRYLLELDNGSTMNFASAGVKQGKSSGTLGRSSGINFVHASEMCSWDNTEGLEAFKNALAQDFPNRLYIWESTGRGYNIWHDMWTEARQDPEHEVCIFSGWWAKDNQVIQRDDPDFERYGVFPPSEKELKKIRAVKEKYDWSITPEQLAWIRRHSDPLARQEGDAKPEFEANTLKLIEQPWTEEDAFQMTGATFFDPETLTSMANKYVSKKFKTYSYSTGIEFVDTRIYPAHNAKSVELKIWEEREDGAVYVIGADVAFGSNEKNDRSAIQVFKCFADGCDQVAEYAWPLINSRSFAWVIMSIAGYYAGDSSEVYLIVELNGPGQAVWDEISYLRRHIVTGYQPKDVRERGLTNIFQNVKNYIYSRPDSMSAGKAWMWKTSAGAGPSGKVRLMERLRDFVSNGMLHVRSLDTLEEMKSVTREGDTIEAQGAKKDDRVMAAALAVRCWEERPRRALMTAKRTRENDTAKRRMTITDQVALYNSSQLTQFFAVKTAQRNAATRAARRNAWKSR